MTSLQSSLKSYFALFCLLLVFAFAKVAKTAPQYIGTPISWKWTQEKWGGNDKPYLKIRKDISAFADAGNLNDAELMRLKKRLGLISATQLRVSNGLITPTVTLCFNRTFP